MASNGDKADRNDNDNYAARVSCDVWLVVQLVGFCCTRNAPKVHTAL